MDLALEELDVALDRLTSPDDQAVMWVSRALCAILDYLHDAASVASLQVRAELIEALHVVRHSFASLAGLG